MPKYIDANALISDSRICGNCKDRELCDGNIAFCPNASARRAINDASTADVEPVRHGQWKIIDDVEHFLAKCSVCGRTEDSRRINEYPYCHCGAKMDGGESHEQT